MKIVISTCFGGFCLSRAACTFLGLDPGDYTARTYYPDRCDPDLVKCVEMLGPEASGNSARLVIVEVPDDVEWLIESDSGAEWIAEVHRTWEG